MIHLIWLYGVSKYHGSLWHPLPTSAVKDKKAFWSSYGQFNTHELIVKRQAMLDGNMHCDQSLQIFYRELGKVKDGG